MHKLLIPVDGSDNAMRALDYAIRLAKEGAKVVLCDVNDAAGAAVAKAIGAAGGNATFVHCDVAKPADVTTAVAAALKAYGRVDVLVNNAGVVDDAPFLDLSLEELDRVLSINLRGAFLMAQAAARQMVKQGALKPGGSAGAIVNMSSINERFGLPAGRRRLLSVWDGRDGDDRCGGGEHAHANPGRITRRAAFRTGGCHRHH